MKLGNDWWTSPTESESGRLVMVTGRRGVEKARESGKYNIYTDGSGSECNDRCIRQRPGSYTYRHIYRRQRAQLDILLHVGAYI